MKTLSLLYILIFINCAPLRTNIEDIDISRVLDYVQNQRYSQYWSKKELKTDRDIFFEACENYNLDALSTKAAIIIKYPEISKKLFR